MRQSHRRSSDVRRDVDALLDAALDTPGWSRRSFIAGTLGFGAMAALAACGGDDDSSSSTAPGSTAPGSTVTAPPATTIGGTAAPTTTSLAAGATVEITDVLGTRQLPAAPARVVCLDGRNDLELAMLCGFPVVGYYDRSTESVALPADLAAVVTDAVKLPFEPNLEQLASLRPELIIMVDSYWVDELGRDTLESIAPLLVAAHDPEVGQAGWREEYTYFLDAFGKTDRITDYLDRYDAAVADVRTRWAEQIDSTALALIQFNNNTGDIVIHPPVNVLVGSIVADLGGHFGTHQSALTEPEVLAAENLGEVDGDMILRSAFELDDQAFDGLEANPLWASMPAVKRGAVLDTAVLLVNYGGPALALECVALLDRVYELAASTAA